MDQADILRSRVVRTAVAAVAVIATGIVVSPARAAEPTWQGPATAFAATPIVGSGDVMDADTAANGWTAVVNAGNTLQSIAVSVRAPDGQWTQYALDSPAATQQLESPRVAIGNDGHVVVAFVNNNDPDNYSRLYVAERDPVDAAFTVTKVFPSVSSQQYLPDVDIDSDGDVLLAYLEENPGYVRAAVKRSGQAWSAIASQRLQVSHGGTAVAAQTAATGGGAERPITEFDGTGRAIVAWRFRNFYNDAVQEVGVNVRPSSDTTAGGFAVGSQLETGKAAEVIDVSTNASGDAAVHFQSGADGNSPQTARVAVSSDGGSFGVPHDASPAAGSLDSDVALAPNGDVEVAWGGYVNNANVGGAQHFDAAGGDWTEELAVPWGSERFNRGAVEADWQGRFVAVWDEAGVQKTARRAAGAAGAFDLASTTLPSGGNSGRRMLREPNGSLTRLEAESSNTTDPFQLGAYRLEKPDEQAPQITITTPPLAKATYNQGQQVTADFACTDDTAVASCTGTMADGQPIATGQAGTNIAFKVRAVDTAGNAAETTHFYDVRAAASGGGGGGGSGGGGGGAGGGSGTPSPGDTASPQVFIARPVSGQRFTLGQDARASYRCADETSLAACTGTVANGAPLDTRSLGAKSLTVTARDGAGHTTTTRVGYFVDAPRAGAPLPPEIKQAAQPVLDAVKKTPSTSGSSQITKGISTPIQAPPNSSIGSAELIARDGAGLIARDGGGLIARDGAGLIARDGGGLIARDGGGLIARDGGGLISDNGLGLISDNGLGLISNQNGVSLTGSRAGGASASAAARKKVEILAASRKRVKKGGRVTLKLRPGAKNRRLLRRTFARKGRQQVKILLAVGIGRPGTGLPAIVVFKTVTVKESR